MSFVELFRQPKINDAFTTDDILVSRWLSCPCWLSEALLCCTMTCRELPRHAHIVSLCFSH
jgi:hypothetical protein